MRFDNLWCGSESSSCEFAEEDLAQLVNSVFLWGNLTCYSSYFPTKFMDIIPDAAEIPSVAPGNCLVRAFQMLTF